MNVNNKKTCDDVAANKKETIKIKPVQSWINDCSGVFYDMIIQVINILSKLITSSSKLIYMIRC